MTGFEHVDSEAAERLRDLADRARSALIAAGIPAFDSRSPSRPGGAEIEVDTGRDEAGGVYVWWTLSAEFTDEIRRYVLSGQRSHPRIQYSGKIKLAMRDAIITILNASGIPAEPTRDEMRPLQIRLSE